MQETHVAIIGLGPRGLTVLERMLEHAHRLPNGIRLVVDAYDDGAPGEGSHSSHQPEHLLINTVASQVSIFAPTSLAGGRGGISLVEWAQAWGYRRHEDGLHRHTPHAGRPITLADHLPRRLLGEYLAWAYQRIVGMMPSHVTVRHRQERVADLCPTASGYRLTAANGQERFADYVFLTTGHGRRKTTDQDQVFCDFVQRHSARNALLRYFSSPYPIEALDGISARATVAIQGLGLTAHDVVSALTLGRGGRYVLERGQLRYLRSGQEPRMLLFSRNSLPFAARGINQKGLTGKHLARFFTADAIASKRRDVQAATGDPRLDFKAHVLPLLLKEMAFAHRCAQLDQSAGGFEDFEPTPEELRALRNILWPLEGQSFPTFESFHAFAHALIAQDLREAEKGNRSSASKAATDVLRDTRDALRAAVEHGGLTPDSHRFFVEDFNAATNRVAFGPPRQRNAEYQALRSAGLIDITGGPGARALADDHTAQFLVEAPYPEGIQRSSADVLVVARLDAYSPLTDASPLTAKLLARGLIRPFRNGDYHPCGLDIDEAMHPVDATGTVRRDMWALGYPVEGPHFYTHALPRPHMPSRQTADAQRCVLELFKAVSQGSRPTVIREQPNESGAAH